jgi:hypothetical protein
MGGALDEWKKYKRIDNFARLYFSPVHTWMIIATCVKNY